MQYIVTTQEFEKAIDRIERLGHCGLAFQFNRPIVFNKLLLCGVAVSSKNDDYFFDIYNYKNKPEDMRFSREQIRDLFFMIGRKKDWWGSFIGYDYPLHQSALHYEAPMIAWTGRSDVSNVARHVERSTRRQVSQKKFLAEYAKDLDYPMSIHQDTSEELRGNLSL